MGNAEKFSFKAKRGPQYFAAFAACLGGFQLGLMNGWTSPGLPDLKERKSLGGGLTLDEESWIASLASLGCLAAVYPSGYLIQKIGRQPVMVYVSVLFTLGWLLMAFATSFPMLMAGRIMTGFTSGVFGVAAPVFIAETAEASIRGALGSCFQLFIVTGILYDYAIGAFVSWRWLAIINIAPTLVCVIMVVMTPESPRHLITVGDLEEAKKALVWFRGAERFEQVEDEYEYVKENVDKNAEGTFRDLLEPQILKPTLIGVSLLMFQQLCGIDAVTFFTVSIFEDAGSTMDANLSTIIVGIVQIFFTALAVVLIERVGRRVLLISSNIVLSISLFTLGLFFFMQDEDSTEVKHGWLPLTSLVVYISAFSMGIGPLAWLFVGEVLPNHVIGIASSLATSMLWILSFLVTRFFEPVNDALGQETPLWFFSACTVVSTIYVYFILPETKGKTLDEVQEIFAPKNTKLKAKNLSIVDEGSMKKEKV